MYKRAWMAAVSLLVCGAAASAEWRIVEAAWRSDTNPFTKKQVWQDFVWAEGWDSPEQFYPNHFQPAGSLHVILRNGSSKPARLQLTHVDGKGMAELATTPERIGPVIYQWVEPEQVAPGAWTECILRLRAVPKADVRLTFQADSGPPFDVLVPIKLRKTRIEGIAFSPAIDKTYVYVRSLDVSAIGNTLIELDGKPVAEGVRRVDGPAASGLALFEVALNPAWEAGSVHLVQVAIVGGDKLVQPIRASDSYFSIGLFGTQTKEKIAAAKAHGFNTYYWGGATSLLDEQGMNYILTGPVGVGRPHTAQQSGRLAYYNLDEPDGHDALSIKTLPLLDRLGVSAMKSVIPIIRQQRAGDPKTANLVLSDNTYKPLNWYVYGQLADIYATDPYVPISAEQIDRVPNSLLVARDACCPHPLISVIWATANSGHRWCKRPPTVQEERMMAFYSLGSGISGLAYFADIGVEGEGGKFLALSDNKALWEEVGRINRDVAAMVPYLATACPLPGPQKHEQVWIRSLMCGPEAMAVFVVNKNHTIRFNTVSHADAHFPAEAVEMSVPVAAHLQKGKVLEVKDGKLVPFAAELREGQVFFKLDVVDTARAFVITP